MTGRRPPYLAVVEPLAAGWLLREVGERAEAYARQAVAYEGTAAAEQGRQLQRALAMFRESARQWREVQAAELAVAPRSGEDVVWLSTADVAVELEVSVRQVGHYIAGGNGALRAFRDGRGRPWRVRADDLEDFRRWRAEVAG